MRTLRQPWVAVPAALLVTAILVVVLSEAFLPGIAESVARGDLEDRGEVRSLDIEATPAFTLLWRSADRADVVMGTFRVEEGELGDVADDADGVGEVRFRANRAELGRTTLEDLDARIDGNRFTADGTVTLAAIQAGLPEGFEARPNGVDGGTPLLRASGGAFGFEVETDVRVEVVDGRVLARASGIAGAVGGDQVVFDDESVRVDALEAVPAGDGYRVRIRGEILD